MSKKIRNGKFVERTLEEEVEFQRLKAEHYANVEKTNPKFKKRPKIKEKFVAIPRRQIDKWNNAGTLPKVTGVYFVLLIENYERQAPFRLPMKELLKLGIGHTTQARAIAILENAGLISVIREHKHPPIITVL
jgi:hypothetical protein